ncbi:GIY-YIG nuclease family protein [Litoribacter populi]|uniref:GIY-YIG nuclease family protein n=1 Tax=Litoribacter populi TaxID=2598460 RepID=UPI001F20E421|nr:GIY-YIG nuclease family protein [Litoribacter populi]
MENFYVYILYSASLNKFYVGQTGALDQRVTFHNDAERNRIWTRRGIPWELKRAFQMESRSKAFKIERLMKSKKSRQYIEEVIEKGEIGLNI